MIRKEQVFITPFSSYRTLHIHLPQDYKNSTERYPVMYMFDGHNLFNDEDATYGTSWGLETFLNSYEKPFIIVGLECNHEGNERLSEFSPYTFSTPYLGHIYGKGDQLMEWMVKELKPYIDSRYRTMPLRECTGIAGSSMGGLMSLYGIIHYNSIFSKAACLSSAVFGCEEKILSEFQNVELSPDTRVYLSWGTKELAQNVFQAQRIKDMQMLANEFTLRNASSVFHLIENGQHNEATWGQQNRAVFDYLWRS